MSNNIGIYKILNLANNKVYIGQSNQLHKRLTNHKNLLKNNRHHNPHLQHSYNKYGFEGFIFEVIEICDSSILNHREIYWMDYYKSFDKRRGYNITSVSEDLTSYALSESTKSKISEAHIKYSDEELLSYLQEFYYMEGKVPTQRDFVSSNYPSYTIYFFRFGSFQNGLVMADIYDFVANKKLFTRELLTRESILENYSEFVKKHNRFPNYKEMRFTSKSGLYSYTSVLTVFNDMEEIKSHFGFSKESLFKQENDEAIYALKRLYDEQGFVESRSIDKSRTTKSASFYSNRFGNLYNAYQLAGIDSEDNLRKSNEYKKKLKSS